MVGRHSDPAYLRNRAEELRVLAESMNTLEARNSLLRCAEDYDVLAKRAEERGPGDARGGKKVGP